MRIRPDTTIEAYIGICIFISAFWFLSHAEILHMAVVVFKNNAVLQNDTILLKNIGEVFCKDVALKSDIENYKIGYYSLPGYTRQLEAEKIKQRLNVFYKNEVKFDFRGSETILLERASKIILGIEIQESVRDYVFKNMPWDPSDVLFGFSQEAQSLQIPTGQILIKIRPEKDAEYLGGERFYYEIFSMEKKIRSVPVIVELRVFQDICITSRKIKRHEVLSPDMIKMEKREITKQKDRYYYSLDSLLGMRTRRTVSADRIITERMIERQPIVCAGEQVNMVSIHGNIRVSLPGIAREEGGAGERISVQSLNSRKILKGIVQKDKSILVSESRGDL